MHIVIVIIIKLLFKQDLGGGLNKIGANLLGVEDLGLKVLLGFVGVTTFESFLIASPIGHRGLY